MSFENEPDDPTQSLELFGDGGGDASQPALPWQGQNQQDFKCHLMRRNLCQFFFLRCISASQSFRWICVASTISHSNASDDDVAGPA